MSVSQPNVHPSITTRVNPEAVHDHMLHWVPFIWVPAYAIPEPPSSLCYLLINILCSQIKRPPSS